MMKRRIAAISLAAALAFTGLATAHAQVRGLASAAASDAIGTDGWANAREVPGTASLNVGGNAGILSVSCTSPGNCAAGGFYGSDSTDAGVAKALVVSQRNGRWGKAAAPPGIDKLQALSSQILTISCSSGGNCTAGGSYADLAGDTEAMLAIEKNGRWGPAVEAPGTAALNAFGEAAVSSVSCPAAGTCLAGGYYYTGPGFSQAFVISERNGQWGTAHRVRGLAGLNQGRRARIFSVSCPSAGNCAVGGFYIDASGRWQAFVASEANGRWSDALEVPGTAALNVGGNANVDSVSCSSPGNCSAGGYYEASAYNGTIARWQAFAASERNGTWARAVPLLPTAAINDNTVGAAAESVSCASPGNCAAGGAYRDRLGRLQAFVASQHDGTWGKAIEVPGTAALNHGGTAETLQVSCGSGGSCNAGGYYSWGGSRAFVVSERNGTWETAIKVPGTTVLDAGRNAALLAISCTSASRCSAGGYYSDQARRAQAFVVSRT